MSNTKIAVYGTLKKHRGNHRLLQGVPFIGKGKTVNKFTMLAHGIPYVLKNLPKVQISVEVYDVSPEDLVNLDSLEGHPRWYRREPTDIKLEDNSLVSAELYFYTPYESVTDEDELKKVMEKSNYYLKEVTNGIF